MRPGVVSTYTGLNRTGLVPLLRRLADSGHERVEILAARPHVDLEDVGPVVAALVPVLASTGLQVSSVVPSGIDVNLASTQAGMRAWSTDQFVATVRLAAALGAPVAIAHPGRRHPLRPPARTHLEELVLEGLDQVAAVAEQEGVRLLLENVPTGLVDTAAECAEIVSRLDGRVGLCFDVANAFMVEDVVATLRERGTELELVHLSDTRQQEWLHAPLGTGEVPWAEVAGALSDSGYAGPVVLETLHDDDPVAGFAHDAVVWEAALLRAAG